MLRGVFRGAVCGDSVVVCCVEACSVALSWVRVKERWDQPVFPADL